LSVTANPPNQHQTIKLATTPIIQLNKTLIINGNNQLSTYASKGDGSKTNPYLLGNYYILLSNRSQVGIELENIDNYFILNNTLIEIYGSSSDLSNINYPKADIQLVNVSHGTVSYSNIMDCYVGIDLYKILPLIFLFKISFQVVMVFD